MGGDPYSRDILCDFASALTTYGKPPPLWLQKYLVSAVRYAGRPRRERGRDPYASSHRNLTIATAIYMLVEFDGYRPTRNTATTTECASSIVAKALERIGINMSEANVVAIWRAVDRVFAQANSSEPEEQPQGRRAARQASAGCACAPGECEDLKHFGPHFHDRIVAFGHVALVSRAETGAIDLRELVDTEVRANGDKRVTTGGPTACLHERAAETMALALSELRNNTVCCGALANSQGRLDVKWETTGGALTLDWHVSGAGNCHCGWCGYMRELIEFAFPLGLGARTRLELARHETNCRIELPNYESPEHKKRHPF